MIETCEFPRILPALVYKNNLQIVSRLKEEKWYTDFDNNNSYIVAPIGDKCILNSTVFDALLWYCVNLYGKSYGIVKANADVRRTYGYHSVLVDENGREFLPQLSVWFITGKKFEAHEVPDSATPSYDVALFSNSDMNNYRSGRISFRNGEEWFILDTDVGLTYIDPESSHHYTWYYFNIPWTYTQLTSQSLVIKEPLVIDMYTWSILKFTGSTEKTEMFIEIITGKWKKISKASPPRIIPINGTDVEKPIAKFISSTLPNHLEYVVEELVTRDPFTSTP